MHHDRLGTQSRQLMIVYSAKTSLNGCVNDATRGLALCESPPREMNAFVNERERSVSTTSTDAGYTR